MCKASSGQYSLYWQPTPTLEPQPKRQNTIILQTNNRNYCFMCAAVILDKLDPSTKEYRINISADGWEISPLNFLGGLLRSPVSGCTTHRSSTSLKERENGKHLKDCQKTVLAFRGIGNPGEKLALQSFVAMQILFRPNRLEARTIGSNLLFITPTVDKWLLHE